KSVDSMFFLQLSLSLMFIAIGIVGLTDYNSDFAQIGRSVNNLFGKSNDIVPVLFAVLQLVAGVLLLLSLFSGLPGRFLSIAMLVIFIFWAVRIAMSFFLNNLFEPDFIPWLAEVSPHLVILSALWIVTRAKN
ncbi:MAG: hypothetical protein JEY91_17985, partial [Spirochaetaceae bacterium]|nr:hypothetical protein [Spirochaetaceae bacterium]